jgi:NAD(P)H dehydrogenase (quinone)
MKCPRSSSSVSSHGQIETTAYAVAEGAKSEGADVIVKRVPELVPDDVANSSYFKMDQLASIATAEKLAEYNAIIVGAGTRFGTVAAQMRNYHN